MRLLDAGLEKVGRLEQDRGTEARQEAGEEMERHMGLFLGKNILHCRPRYPMRHRKALYAMEFGGTIFRTVWRTADGVSDKDWLIFPRTGSAWHACEVTL